MINYILYTHKTGEKRGTLNEQGKRALTKKFLLHKGTHEITNNKEKKKELTIYAKVPTIAGIQKLITKGKVLSNIRNITLIDPDTKTKLTIKITDVDTVVHYEALETTKGKKNSISFRVERNKFLLVDTCLTSKKTRGMKTVKRMIQEVPTGTIFENDVCFSIDGYCHYLSIIKHLLKSGREFSINIKKHPTALIGRHNSQTTYRETLAQKTKSGTKEEVDEVTKEINKKIKKTALFLTEDENVLPLATTEKEGKGKYYTAAPDFVIKITD